MALFKKEINPTNQDNEFSHAILIVDDEPANLKTIKRLLENEYEIHITESGKEALEILRKKEISQKIHLIISDQRMPKMSGIEFLCKSIELVPLAIRIILTGYTDVNEIIDSINNAAIYKFITKPIEPENFKITVKRAIEAYELESQNFKLIKELQDLNSNLEIKVNERTKELEKAFFLLEKYNIDLEKERDKLEAISIIDELTQLHNRRYINHKLEEEVERSKRYSNQLSIALFDIDHFKKINDSHGHPKGDSVLVEVSEKIKKSQRNTDHSSRFGGEEFLLIFPETVPEDAIKVCERIRLEIETEVSKNQKIKVTISGGVTSFRKDDNLEQFLKRADQLLYDAKNQGRNRIISD